MSGYIKLHRQLLDSLQFQNPNTLKIWIWMLLKATHKEQRVCLKVGKGYTTVELKRGEFIFGRNAANKELNLEPSLIYRVVKVLHNDGTIVVKPNNQYSIITICNYDTYNELENNNEQPVNNRRTAGEQPTDTYNNDKNVKNVKKKGSKLPFTSVEVAFIKVFNDTLGRLPGREFKTLDDKTRRQFADILGAGRNSKDFIKTIKIAAAEMGGRGKLGYLTPEFLTRPAEWEKYFNMDPSDKIIPEVYTRNPQIGIDHTPYEKSHNQ